MAEAFGGILKFVLSLISNKVRSYGAEKLKDGGLTDQIFRDWIIPELDEIKFKLDGLSRKDLSTSVSYLKMGLSRLKMSLEDSIKSGKPSRSELYRKDERQSQDRTNAEESTSAQTKLSQKPVIEEALALVNAIGKPNIESSEIFELAKESFKEAGKKASDAFHNAALSTEERVLACKVRIASGILEHLEYPEVAASDCLQYLQELHNMSGTQKVFSVHVNGGMKSLFKKESRAAIVETVTAINLKLAEFISTFTKRRMGIFDWPMIECGRQVVHPVHYGEKGTQKMKEMGIKAPWDTVIPEEIAEVLNTCYVINSKGNPVDIYRGCLQKPEEATKEVHYFLFELWMIKDGEK